MDDRSLKGLDFYDLLEILKEFSVSPLGRQRCSALRPFKDSALILSRLAEVLELKEILETAGDLPVRGLNDIGGILRRLELEGSTLSVQELLEIYGQMELCKGLKRFFQKLKIVEAPHLQEKVSRLSSPIDLEKEILQVINTKGEILDRASPGLFGLRQQIGKIREKAKGVLEHLLHQEKLQPIFQEQLITLRNGRYVLLIKSEYKHRLEGIIHDQSQSHMTFFFEPLQVVSLNNEINILVGEEKEEEYRILTDLSEKVRDERQSFWTNLEILGELDLLYAMAKLAMLLKGVQPLLSTDGKIDMKEARNPLLTLREVGTTRFREGQVVPVHLRMGDGIRVLIVSGANAGGKTVALKTLGLLTLMVQCGLPIPVAEGSEVGIFEKIFAVIGDEQSIGENLSTFSSHLLHVHQVLEKAGPRSLILLDELGVGTHASEGCALALGFLDQFRETGASVVVTTHFDGLKAYGYFHPDVENVAVEFDGETFEPKYTLSYGSSGLSNAFAVAEKLGVSEKVLEMARHHREGGEIDVSRALETLERLKADTEKERLQFLEMKREVELQRQRLKELLEGIKKRRQEIFSQAEVKGRKAVLKVEEELKEWIRRQKEERSHSKGVHFNVFRGEIQAIKERSFPSVKREETPVVPGGLKVGEHVRIVSLGSCGRVVGVEASLNQVEVMTERARVKTTFSDIVKVTHGDEEERSEIPKTRSVLPRKDQRPLTQLNVIGLTVDDALPRVDKFIDQALLHGLEKVYIVHGVGSGRLGSAIGNYLRDHQGVGGFARGEGMKGGRGITVVELR
jgi:DNA mismatch repair protein MutS2